MFPKQKIVSAINNNNNNDDDDYFDLYSVVFANAKALPGEVMSANLKKIGYVLSNTMPVQSFCVLLDEFSMSAFVKTEVARAPNQQSISGFVEKVHPYVQSRF